MRSMPGVIPMARRTSSGTLGWEEVTGWLREGGGVPGEVQLIHKAADFFYILRQIDAEDRAAQAAGTHPLAQLPLGMAL